MSKRTRSRTPPAKRKSKRQRSEAKAHPRKQRSSAAPTKKQPKRSGGVKQKKQTRVESDEDEEYEVDTLLSKRVRGGIVEYLVSWKGYDDQTWEPTENLPPVIVQVFEDAAANARDSAEVLVTECHEQVRDQDAASIAVGSECDSIEVVDSDEDWIPNTDQEQDAQAASGISGVCDEVQILDSDSQGENVVVDLASNANQVENDAGASSPARPLLKSKKSSISRKNTKSVRQSTPSFMAQLLEAGGGECASVSPETDVSGEVSNNPVEDMYVNKLVAFCPEVEPWMAKTKEKKKRYQVVGSTYIVGRVCKRFIPKRKKGEAKPRGPAVFKFKIVWLDTVFQSEVEEVTLDVIIKGIENHVSLCKASPGFGWTELCRSDEADRLDIDDGDELEAEYTRYDPGQNIPTSIEEVEAIKNMNFDPQHHMRAPADLYTHEDGSTTTRVKPECKFLFEHSASSSFFAYMPVSFWRQVLTQTNQYAQERSINLSGRPVTMQELMTFLGILFYMALVSKGEYSNYWGPQLESAVFDDATDTSLDSVMPIRRFKLIRKALCFRCDVSAADLARDPAVRIRSVLNLLKITGPRYVNVGRNLAVDEASVACRSKFGRGLIVFNSTKPGGKYHFRMYMCCCSTSWISLNFRLHSGVSKIEDRLLGVTSVDEMASFRDEISAASLVRQHVLEAVRPFYHTKRIVTTDNFYTSVQLLEALRVKGLYGRGTIRGGSKHFPTHVILDQKTATRGEFRQGVSLNGNMVAASWCDGNIVSVVSNADNSDITKITRQVKKSPQTFDAPTCISEYNINMQGVDRLDQMRGRFSICDGHSFKKWHKKLAMAMIDIGRVNGYMTWKLVRESNGASERDPHRAFMVQLIKDLFSGKWAEAPNDLAMPYGVVDPQESPRAQEQPSQCWRSPSMRTPGGSSFACAGVSSKQMFQDFNQKRRNCVVCRWEGRKPTQVTDFCCRHQVCLCKKVYTETPQPYACPRSDLTCWQKFHQFYLDEGLFTSKGNVKLASKLYKLKLASQGPPVTPNRNDVASVGRSCASPPVQVPAACRQLLPTD